MDRRAFLDQEPPPGYIPGVGRGAVGFTTSADTAITRVEPGFLVAHGDDDDDDTEGVQESRTETGLLGIESNDKDDEEAENIYREIERRITKKPANEPVQTDTSLQNTFSDLKRDLSSITNEQWANLSEVGDLTRRNKRARLLEQQQQRFYAVPDSVLAGAGGGRMGTGPTNFQSISLARDKLLSTQLDEMLPVSDTPQNTDIIDLETKGSQFGDIKKGRLILSSLRRTEPGKANSWIASSRLEEQAHNLKTARNLIVEGCRKCPRSESVWLESIRLHLQTTDGTKVCKGIVGEALSYVPRSEKLWLKAFELERNSGDIAKRKVLMKALEQIPTSVVIWRELIELEDEPEEVKPLLSKAIELCPQEWEFWVLLINLSSYSEAKTLLNKARKSLNGDYKVWIAACKLEERENDHVDEQKLIKMMEKAFKDMYKNADAASWQHSDDSKQLSRQKWLDEARKAQSEGFSITSKAIIVTTLQFDETMDISNKFQTWFHDAHELENHGLSNTIYQFLIAKYPHNVENWLKLLSYIKNSEKAQGKFVQLFEYYQQAIEMNPGEELFVLMYSKDKWKLVNDVDSARNIIKSSLHVLPASEELWLARLKLEIQTHNFTLAHKVGRQAMANFTGGTDSYSSERVWLRYIHFLRFVQETERALVLSEEALSYYPKSYKLYLQRSQILADLNQYPEAREVLSCGIKTCPDSPELWISLALLEETSNILIKARSTLDKALLVFPVNEKIWAAKIDLERRNKDLISARQLTNKALKLLPASPLVWHHYLSLITKSSQRKNALVDALKATDNNAYILMSIGKFFWLDGKFDKAKSWFERSLDRDDSSGDAWAWLYAFWTQRNDAEQVDTLVKKFESNYDNINRGDVWISVTKAPANLVKSPLELLQETSKKLTQE